VLANFLGFPETGLRTVLVRVFVVYPEMNCSGYKQKNKWTEHDIFTWKHI